MGIDKFRRKAVFKGKVIASDDITMKEGKNIIAGTTTGTKIGTAITQKIAFYASTPIIQKAGAAQVAAPAGGTGTADGGYDTAENRDAAIALLNEIRTVLVNLGLMKGSA